MFAKCIRGTDVKVHDQVITNSGDSYYNYMFTVKVKTRKRVVFKYGSQIKSELELLDNYLDDVIASLEKEASKSMTK